MSLRTSQRSWENPNEVWKNPNEVLENSNEIWENPNEVWENSNEIWENSNEILENPNEVWENPNEVGENPNEVWENPNEQNMSKGSNFPFNPLAKSLTNNLNLIPIVFHSIKHFDKYLPIFLINCDYVYVIKRKYVYLYL